MSGAGGAVRPTPSPDGKYLAFVRRVRGARGPQSTLFLKDLRSGREFAAWGHLERDLQESWSVHGVYPAFAWTPDARVIVVWAQGKLWRDVAYGGLDGEHYWYARTDVWKHPILSKFVPRSVLEPRSVRRETAPDEDFNVIQVAKTATELERAGTRTNIGAHGQREGLRSTTLNPARYLGLDRDIGSLEQGKLVDLVVIDGDVLQDIRQSDRISQVMMGGRLYAVPGMDEVAPRQKARKPFLFEGEAAGTPLDADALAEGHGHHGH